MIAKPKPASTVVLVDEEYNVFLTKRPESMKFLGGFFVFPGGGMDAEDTVVKEDLCIGGISHHSLNRGHYIAAARELFEEVGILLGTTVDGSSINLTKGEIEKYQERLLAKEITFGEILENERILFNFDSLRYFGQITTPKKFPMRFDTKFFLTTLPKGQTPTPNSQEIDEAFWASPEEGLRLYHNKEIKLAPPTIVVLESITAYKKGGKLELENEKVEQLAKNFSFK